MATLADSFLADFESDSESEEEFKDEKQEFKVVPKEEDEDDDDAMEPTVKDFDLDEDAEDDEKEEGVREIANLLEDPALQHHLEVVRKLMKDSENENGIHTKVDKETEYPIIVKSNQLAADIDQEIANIHKFVRDIYSTKFAELEQLVPSPMEYSKVVKVIGNETDMTVVDKELATILPQSTILTISVTATHTAGKPLPEEELKKAFGACDAIMTLDEHKREIYEYIESRMAFIAPNLSAITGTEIAARLMGIAGGLDALSKIPACNVQVLGVKRKNLGGLSAAKADLHAGLVASTDIIAACPPLWKQKALRLVAAKCVLAARIDAMQDDATGQKGKELREEIEEKIQKWQEPPPPKQKRALPVPNDKQKKRRGGKRYRKFKEKYRVTEIQKQKNRMSFNTAEITDDFTGEGFGMLGQAGSGVLTIKKENTQKLKDHLSKKTQARLSRQRAKGTATATPGISSSIAFTPVQGMELVNPELLMKPQESGNKYFGSEGGFFKVGNSKAPARVLPPVPKFP